ncbi:Uncharacterized protein conserved in bacteria [Trueperella bialowiezensis]|uniref:Uncharacterized protein conserved in bacteria n=2 Tax=Trueperella bialowiezensis TaxID=312285 RepID=A0A448PFB1_9ACTO|nr:Uncharacterized protein conserved in bacteria [Trueperella bialowiezensis]
MTGVIVPLTFLRKGPIVNLGISGPDGNTRSSVGFLENALLTYSALCKLSKDNQIDEIVDNFLKEHDIWASSDHQRDSGSVNSETLGEKLVKIAIWQVITSSQTDYSASHEGQLAAKQDVHRHEAFGTVASIISALRHGRPLRSFFLTVWPIFTSEKSGKEAYEHEQRVEIRAVDSSPAILILILSLLETYIEPFREAHKDNKNDLVARELFCILMSAVSLSYLSAVVTPEGDVYAREQDEQFSQQAGQVRAVFKMSSDIEPNLDSDKRDSPARNSTHVRDSSKFKSCYDSMKLWSSTAWETIKRFFSDEKGSLYNFDVSLCSAESAHIEFNPPQNLVIAGVYSMTGNESNGYESEYSDILTFAEIKIASRNDSERQGSFSESSNLSQKAHRRDSYRTSPGIIHISPSSDWLRTVGSYAVQLIPNVAGANRASIATLLGSAAILLIQLLKEESGAPAWSNFFGAATLILAIYAAILFTTGRSEIEHRVLRYTNIRILVMFIFAFINIICAFLLSRNHAQHKVAIFCISAVFILLFGFCNFRTNKKHKDLKKEVGRLSEVEDYQVRNINSRQSRYQTIALTETGPYDVHYLTAGYLTKMKRHLMERTPMGLEPSKNPRILKEYIRDFHPSVKSHKYNARSEMTDLNRLIIAIDLDGVCADYISGFRDYMMNETGHPASEFPTPQHYDLSESGWPFKDYDSYHRYHKQAVISGLYRKLPVIPGAAEAVKELSDIGYHIRIVTHRLTFGGSHAQIISDTAHWLDDRKIPFGSICFSSVKDDINADLYIEDSPSNIELLRKKGITTFVFSHEYNCGIDGPRFDDWKVGVQLVQKELGGPRKY